MAAKRMGVGKVVLIAVIALVAVGAIGSCARNAGNSAPSAASSASAASAASGSFSGNSTSANQKPDRNGFDEATNQAVEICGVRFSFPSYFKKKGSKNGVETYSAANADGASEGALAFCVNTGTKVASAEVFQAKKESAITTFLEAYKIKDLKVVDTVDGGIAGLSSGIYTFTGKATSGNAEASATIRAAIFLNGNREVGVLVLVQIDASQNNYLPDFDKILASATVVDQAPAANADASGVSPDIKAALDSYEAFMDDYIAFMQKYKNSRDTASMMNDYLTYLQKYADLVAKIEAMDTNNMSAADSAYYLEVTTRVSQKLLQAAV